MKTVLGLLAGIFILFVVFGVMSKVGEVNRAVEKETSTDPKFVVLRSAKLDYTWQKSGFGSVMVADFTVTNPTTYGFKDVAIKYTHAAPSGTVIDSNTRTVYEIVPPKGKKRFRDVNIGFIHSQATRSGCEITDLALVSPGEQARLEAEAKAVAERQQRERARKTESDKAGAAHAEAHERANREFMHSKLLEQCAPYKGQPADKIPTTCSPVMGEINR